MTEDTFHLGIKALIRNDTGDILVIFFERRIDGGYWDLPGGRVHHDETILDALRREVAEETGLTPLQTTRHIGMALSKIRIAMGESTVGLILSIYECTVADLRNIQLSDEHARYRWMTPADTAKKLRTKYPDEFCTQIANLS